MKKIGIVVILIVGATAFYFGSQRAEVENEITSQNKEQNDVVEEGGPQTHPVSLQALIQKDFDGRELKLGRVLDENSVYTRYYVTYQSGELTISGIMNVPKGAGPFPLLVLNHGFIDPAVYTNGRGLKREQDYLARRGYVVLHPDYRNHADSSKDPENDINFRLGYTEDVINAVLAAQNSGLDFIDSERVGMLGHSMGGGVTENILVVRPDLVSAAVLFAPVSGDQRDNFERWTTTRPEVAEEVIDRFGSFIDNPDFWDNVSANTFLSRVVAPVMIHHGTADESVPLEWSEEFDRKLSQAGKDTTLYIYEGEPHEFVRAWTEVMVRTTEFFDDNLK